MTYSPARRPDAGFSLVELLIAMVVLSLVMGSAVAMLRSQSKNFRVGGTKMELTQNIRYSISTIDRVLRTTGAGTGGSQPMFVFGSNDAVVFNANYATDVPDGIAVYVNPDLPAGATDAMTTALQMILPGTAIAYPTANYFWGGGTPSRAETIALYFRPDSTTAADPNDFVLVQRVNAMAPELIARNIRAYPGRPFFEYWYDSVNVSGVVFSRQLLAARAANTIPIRHSVALHGDPADVGLSAMADSIRMVRVNLVVTNGIMGVDSLSRRLSTMIRLPNNGLVQLRTCGDPPIFTSAVVATPNIINVEPPAVTLTWLPSVDETSGERDVSQYNIYFRVVGQPTWEPFMSLAAGQANYSVTSSSGLVVGTNYQYAVAAQDCSPAESPLVVSNNAIVNP